MKARIKLILGMVLAGAAVMAVSESSDPAGIQSFGLRRSDACYTQAEVNLLMKSNHWSRQDAEAILKLACQFSKRSN